VETGERESLTSAAKVPINLRTEVVCVEANEAGMIQLTRLNNQPLMVNSDLIKFIEKAPDTVLTLVSGEKVVVLESCEQVLEKVVEFRRTILSGVKALAPEPKRGSDATSSGNMKSKVE
jgi:flagellar protein FlbD